MKKINDVRNNDTLYDEHKVKQLITFEGNVAVDKIQSYYQNTELTGAFYELPCSIYYGMDEAQWCSVIKVLTDNGISWLLVPYKRDKNGDG